MAPSEQYQRQVALLVEAIPLVAAETDFALKGGTAINLFIRDMPRLSVDIDLTFLPVAPRPDSLAAIDSAMRRIATRLREGLPGAQVTEVLNGRENIVTKLTLRRAGVQIKIEVTPVLRGCVFAPEVRTVSPSVERTYGFAQIQVVSFADLYAGKIMAALDRQHPRDLFDIRDLLANEGITDDLRRAFIIYLISHDRPISEVIVPRKKDIAQEFAQGFEGMTTAPVVLADLLVARDALIATMAGDMPEDHKQFLLGFKRGTPNWGLLDIAGAAELPAVRWKQLNLGKLPAETRAGLVTQLATVLKIQTQ